LRRNGRQEKRTSTDQPLQDGSVQALDHMANWVRFADTKATILTAGLGVVITMLMANSRNVITALTGQHPLICIVWVLAILSVGALVFTLTWLILAIGPRSTVSTRALNRFAWPTLLNTTTEQLSHHATVTEAREDAWQQIIDLSGLAEKKFKACAYAVFGFATSILLAVACIATATVLTA
jgi:hypothetical protein